MALDGQFTMSDSDDDAEDLAWAPPNRLNPDGPAQNLVQVTIITSTAALHQQPTEVLMFGSSEALGRGEVPHQMRRISHGPRSATDFLWEITVEMSQAEAAASDRLRGSLSTVSYVLYKDNHKFTAELAPHKITTPLRRRYFHHIVRSTGAAGSQVGARPQMAPSSKKTKNVDEENRDAAQAMHAMYDYILWDFERGTLRNATDYAPLMTPAMFIESVLGLTRDFSPISLKAHALAVWAQKNLPTFELGHAFSKQLEVAHVPANTHVLTMAAVYALLPDKREARRARPTWDAGLGSASIDFLDGRGEDEDKINAERVENFSRWLIKNTPLLPPDEVANEVGIQFSQVIMEGLRRASLCLYAEHDSLDWFRVLPMLRLEENREKFKTISLRTSKQSTKLKEEFTRLCHTALTRWGAENAGSPYEGWERFTVEKKKVNSACTAEELCVLRARKLYLKWLAYFCPSMSLIHHILAPLAHQMESCDVRSMMKWIRMVKIFEHDFFSAHEVASFADALRDYPLLFYGADQCSRDVTGNVMAEAVLRNESLSKYPNVDFTIRLLRCTLGESDANGKTVNATKKWLRMHFARDINSAEEERVHSYSFVGVSMLNALRAWEAFLHLPCFNYPTSENPLLSDLSQRWFFRITSSIVMLQAVLDIELKQSFPTSSTMLAFIQRVVCDNLLQAVKGGESLHDFIGICVDKATLLRFNIVYGCFQRKLQLVETVFTHPQLLPLADLLTHAQTVTKVIIWVRSVGNDPVYASAKLKKLSQAVVFLFTQLREEVKDRTVKMGDLYMIATHPEKAGTHRENLLHLWTVISNVDLRPELVSAEAELTQFDKELREFSVYTKMYCLGCNIEVNRLDTMVNELREHYETAPLKDFVGSFKREPALHHVSWLYSLRESALFFGYCWAVAVEEVRSEREVDQRACVSLAIPRSKQLWVELEAKLRTETCPYKECLKMFGEFGCKTDVLKLDQIFVEIRLLDGTTPSQYQGTWVENMEENVRAIRRLERLTIWVPTLIKLGESLKDFIFLSEKDPLMDKLRKANNLLLTVDTWTLADVITKSKPLLPLLELLTYELQDYLITICSRDDLVQFLIREEHRDVNAFKTRLRLVRQSTDDDRLLSCLLQLGEVRGSLDEVLYTTERYENLSAFLRKVTATDLGQPQHLKSIQTVVASLDALLDLLDRNTENAGVKACKEVKRICKDGKFIVNGTSVENEQLTCQIENGELYKFEALVEMRKLLLITDVPEEQAESDSGESLKTAVDQFVAKLKILEDIRQACAQLYHAGHFLYTDCVVFEASPLESANFFHSKLCEFQQEYQEWLAAEKHLRQKYYFINFFLIPQLRILRDTLLGMQGSVDMWQERFYGLTMYICGPTTDIAGVQERLLQASRMLDRNADPKTQMEQIAQILHIAYDDVVPRLECTRIIEKPHGSSSKEHQGSLAMALSVEHRDKSMPVFCATTPDLDTQVLDLLLSIYFRRERLPLPEELLVCNESTTQEEIELLFRRFITAGAHHRTKHIFCVANVHQLPYTTQCMAVELLRTLLSEYDLTKAALLVFLSGDPIQPQVLMTSAATTCRAQALAIPIMRKKDIQATLRNACPNVSAIISDINGGGKTTEILIEAFRLQEKLAEERKPRESDVSGTSAASQEAAPHPVVYHHVSLRENASAADFVAQLAVAPDPALVHIDVSHVVPRKVNALLFDLLCVGAVWDPKTLRVATRRQSLFQVEVPNTPNEVMCVALSLIQFIPTKALEMKAERVLFELPKLHSDGIVRKEHNIALLHTVRWIRAIGVGRFKWTEGGEEFTDGWDQEVLLKEPVTQKEAWDILSDRCCDDSGSQPPSFLVFNNFCIFMYQQFQRVLHYKVLGMHLAKIFNKNLRHVFCRMLVETTQSFCLRQVPKIKICIDDIWEGALKACLQRGSSGPSWHQSSAALMRTSSGAGELQRGNSTATPMARQMSGNFEAFKRSDSAFAEETNAAGKVKSENYIHRFNQMSSWESTDHPVTIFPLDEEGKIKGVDLIALNNDAIIDKYMDAEHAKFLDTNLVRVKKDWTRVTTREAIDVIRKCRGLPEMEPDSLLMQQVTHGRTQYVVTIDNLLKTLSILLRLEYGLPVIMMGETGCGKTALVQFIAEALEFPMEVLDVHGGITDREVIKFMHNCIQQAQTLTEGKYLVAFLDEINAGNVMGICKSVIVDRMLEGKIIPSNVRIVACCNPYRMRKNVQDEEMALVYQHHSLDGGVVGITQSMKNLVYRVHQLPESLIDLVSDFGAISTKTEELYIRAILFRELVNTSEVPWFTDFVELFSRLILCSQEYTRKVNSNERSVVSLRDIARTTRVFHWFLEKFPTIDNTTEITPKENYRAATILTLSYCYNARLNREKRDGFFVELSAVWESFVAPETEYDGDRIEWLDFSTGQLVAQDAHKFQLKFVKKMILGDGIALNEALRENLFMLLVSVMNHVPIFVIGKPGCSKSLAVEILQRNLNGVASEEPLFKSLPALQVMAYQCSPLSTASGLLNQFNNARKYAGQDRSTTIVCVLLDEVGLAEESPHLPLKVLHKELEQLDGISCIGISNWALDAAKMSRAVTLFRPPPTIDDLCQTAKDMVANHVVRAYLPALSRGFYDVYRGQKRSDFWGLREFYSIVRVINSELKRQQQTNANSTPMLDATTLMNTVCRNFGGRTASETDDIVDVFFSHCGLRKDDATRLTVRQLILRNLEEPDARHLMLLTQNNSALRLLFDAGICHWETTEVLFGSSFSDDQSDMSVATNLNKIKTWMQRPMSLILVQCDSLYESLYDLLNQHYVELAGQRYVRIAHGSSSKECPVHHLFRIIVIVEKWDAWTTLAPPLLNRFEKQVFLRSAMVERDMHFELLSLITQYLNAMVDDYFCEDDSDGFPDRAQRIVVGYHVDLLPSLVVSLDVDNKERDELFGEAMRRIIWVMSPECVTALSGKSGALRLNQYSDKANHLWPSLHHEYFAEQAHEDLRDFAAFVQKNENMWTDECGGQYIVTTFTPIGANVVETLNALPSKPQIDHITLHDFKAGADFEQRVDAFYAKSCEEGILLVQADVWASPVRQLEFCRYTCERKRRDWMSRNSSHDSKRYVILVVHLVRGAYQKFSFEFDRRWRTVFIDAVTGATTLGLPALNEMLHQPLGEAMKKVNLRQVLSSQVLRPALAQLIYPTKRTFSDLTNQIRTLLHYIHNDDFLQCLGGILGAIFETFDANLKKEVEKMKQKAIDAQETFSGSQYEWHVMAQTPERMRRAGTFRAALHSRLLEIMQALTSRLLAWFDRNGQLELFGRGGATRKMWLDMAHYSVLSSTVKEALLSCLSQDDPHSMQEVINDSVSDPFVAKFPFSFTITARIADLRAELASNLDAGASIETVSDVLARLAKQWKLSQIPIDPNFASNGVSQDDYMSDFVMMRLQKSRLHQEEQQQLLFALCRKSLGLQPDSAMRSIFDVHVGYWLNQKRVFNLNQVLSAVPSSLEQVLQTIAEHTQTPDHTLDVHLMNTIINAHMMVLLKMSDDDRLANGSKLEKWCADARVVSYMAASVLHMTASGAEFDGALEKLHESMYAVLLLAYHFVRDVIQPLNLSISILHEALYHLPPKVRSIGSCSILLDAFERIIEVLPKEKTASALTACSIVLEWFILNLCVPDAVTLETREPDLLKLLVRTCGGSMWAKVRNEIVPRLAPPKMEYLMSFCELSGSHKIPKTSSFMLSLLRKCLVSSKVQPLVEKELGMLLKRQAENYGHGDIPLMQILVLAHELVLVKTCANISQRKWLDDISAISIPDVYHTLEMEEKAAQLSIIRHALGDYARLLRAMYSREDGEDSVSSRRQREAECQNELMAVVAPWLVSNQDLPVRSMRLFVLKHLNHMGGHTELQNALSKPPLSDTAWVQAWRKDNDTPFDRFIGASVLPKWDPFADVDSYKQASAQAVSKFINSNGNDTRSLDNFSMQMVKNNNLLAGFFLTCASDAGLQYALPTRPGWLPKLHKWMKTSSVLRDNVPTDTYNLMRIFSGDNEWCISNRYLKNFVLHDGVSGERVFQYRFLAHFFAACLGADPHSPLQVFLTWMTKPDQLPDTWCICTDQDLRETFQKILEKSEGYTLTESRFYTCPNGHQYVIGNCGRAYEVGKCPECDAEIGGGGHQSSAGNVRMDRGDKSPAGYTFVRPVKENDETEMYDMRRELPPASFRCLRLMLHSAMLLGVVSSIHEGAASNRSGRRYEPTFAATHTKLRGKEDEWFCDMFNADWLYLKKLLGQNVEEMSKVLHDLLTRLMTVKSPAYSDGTFKTLSVRNNYEKYVHSSFLGILTSDGLSAKLLELNDRWRSVEGPFMHELAQSADLESFSVAARNADEPLLWCYYKHFDFSVLSQSLYSCPTYEKTYPILTSFVSDFQKFESMKELYGVVDFQYLLTQKFSRTITKQQAQKLTFKQVFAQLRTATERTRWKSDFDAWSRAWNSGMTKWIKNWECLELPEEYRAMRMDENITLSFLLPGREDEAICGLVLIESITEAHNSFMEIVQKACGEPIPIKGSRLIDQKDALNYDIDQLLSYCRESAVSPLPHGGVVCDLLAVERHLKSIFSKKPKVKSEIRMQVFAFQDSEAVSMNVVSGKLPQSPLSRSVTERLKVELRDKVVLHELRTCLKTTIGFLSRTLMHSLDADHTMLLSDYWAHVLDADGDIPSHIVRTEVKLMHLEALWEVVDMHTTNDFEAVMDMYREKLTTEQRQSVESFAYAVDDANLSEVLSVLKAYIVQWLIKDDRKHTDMLKIWLAAMPDSSGDTLAESAYFEEFFPDDLPHAVSVETYSFLRDMQQSMRKGDDDLASQNLSDDFDDL